MKNRNLIPFAYCPNHETNEGFGKLYFISHDEIKCSLCGKEFTRKEIEDGIKRDYQYKLMDLQRWYQQNLASLYKSHRDDLDKFNKEF